MKITDLLVKDGILLNAHVSSKAEAIDKMVELMEKTGSLRDKETYKAQVLKREEEGTTGIGEGSAIPHGKCDAVIKPARLRPQSTVRERRITSSMRIAPLIICNLRKSIKNLQGCARFCASGLCVRERSNRAIP